MIEVYELKVKLKLYYKAIIKKISFVRISINIVAE